MAVGGVHGWLVCGWGCHDGIRATQWRKRGKLLTEISRRSFNEIPSSDDKDNFIDKCCGVYGVEFQLKARKV